MATSRTISASSSGHARLARDQLEKLAGTELRSPGLPIMSTSAQRSLRPIFFNGKFYSGDLNGVHRVADKMIRELVGILAEMPAEQRPDITLIAPAQSSWLPKLQTIRTTTVGRTNQLWEQFVLPRLARKGVLVNLANLSPILHKRKITLIHDAQFLFPDCGYPLKQRLGYRFLVPSMARSSSHVVTVSEYSRRMLELFNIADRANIKVIHNGGDHILESPASDLLRTKYGLDEQGYVVMFGCPKPYKNNRVVLEAFSRNALSPLKLVLVGSSREELARAELAIPDSAVFVGRPSDSELRGLLNHALALACPSITEGFGLPPLEAMFCGCPAIVTPSGAIPEVCEDAALYASVDDPQSWRDAIWALHTDKALRSAKISQGLDRSKAMTWDAACHSLLDLIVDLSAQD